jgi:hypothetical protein
MRASNALQVFDFGCIQINEMVLAEGWLNVQGV